ncbi:hypothetical protein KQX54_014336 [Cotesia glomerata]|uniref:Uncharacterized protein n=1 Tax=Cotesia glomerata TaxID=32391 RepID=A0AAV7IS02_COTGL|nr:hypothetical protein KQX54_014336 [Cotesia glomerata]
MSEGIPGKKPRFMVSMCNRVLTGNHFMGIQEQEQRPANQSTVSSTSGSSNPCASWQYIDNCSLLNKEA